MATNANGCLSASAVAVGSSTFSSNANADASASASLSMLSNATTSAGLKLKSDTVATAKEVKQFWAIRRCEGLNSPAIFSDWGDCSVYVDPMENDGSVVEFKSFPTIQEAINYAFGSPAGNQQEIPQSPSFAAKIAASSPINTSSNTTNTIPNVAPTASSTQKNTTPISHSKNGIYQSDRSTSWNSEVAISTANSCGTSGEPKAPATQTTATTVPAVTPTEMDSDIQGKRNDDGSRGGRNYRRSVNTTYSSGEDEPVEESAGKDPVEPSDDDVLCGRGGLTNHHPGNKRFRSIVKQYQQDYLRADRGKKASFGHKIYSEIQSHQGRFLQRMPGSSKEWYDIGKVRAIAKICQALREDAPTIRGGKRQQNRSQQQQQRQQQNSDSSSLKRPLPNDTTDVPQAGTTVKAQIMSTPTHHIPPQDMTAYYQSQPPQSHLSHPGMHFHYPSPANHPGLQPIPSPAPESSPQAPPQKMQKRLSQLDQLLAAANMAQAPNAAPPPEGQMAPSQSLPPTASPQPTPFGPMMGTPRNSSKNDFPPACHTSPHVVMFMKTCAPLQGVPPPYFQGNMEQACEMNLPEFMMLANYPNIAHNQCKMCGLERALKSKAAKVSAKKDGNKQPTIPSQNKGVCTACDSQIWVIIDERPEASALKGSQIKWCKGCKNFRPWASFGFKGSATKCSPCRESQAERYKGRKQAKQQMLQTRV